LPATGVAPGDRPQAGSYGISNRLPGAGQSSPSSNPVSNVNAGICGREAPGIPLISPYMPTVSALLLFEAAFVLAQFQLPPMGFHDLALLLV